MSILAIDPGTTQSAFVYYANGVVVSHDISENNELLTCLKQWSEQEDVVLVYEMIACYGMPVGASVFETCVWIGRFIEAWGRKTERVFRKDVKMYLCNSTRAKDGNVRQALIDRFEPTGGGKTPQIGTKAQPGPLYGMRRDTWAALGVAVTFCGEKT